MSDLIERLRRLYVQCGTDYVQEAADEIERLRARLEIDPSHSVDGIEARDATIKAQDKEIERLTAALKWKQHRAERQGTHGEGCANWGPAHYECLLRERDELRRQLAEAVQDARRLNWLDDQWQDPIHLEVGTRRVNEYRLERECVLFLPIGETRGSDVRAAIDAAMGLTRPAEE